jgi:hypothetical protein
MLKDLIAKFGYGYLRLMERDMNFSFDNYIIKKV